MDQEAFIEAIRSKNKIRITYHSDKDGKSVTRTIAPLDYGPHASYKDKTPRYQFWDYEGSSKPHSSSLLVFAIEKIEVLDDTFDPSEFITWKCQWHVARDWGDYS